MADLIPIVFIADDDDGVRLSIEAVMRSVGLMAKTYRSADDLIADVDCALHGCIILDIRMPGLHGLAAQKVLRERGCELPVIIVSAFADVATTVHAMKEGAVDVIMKPFSNQVLIDAVQRAVARDAVRAQKSTERSRIQALYAQLTPRQRDVMALIVQGSLNREAAASLGISEKTIKAHRAQVLHKMHAASIVDLVRMAELLHADSQRG